MIYMLHTNRYTATHKYIASICSNTSHRRCKDRAQDVRSDEH